MLLFSGPLSFVFGLDRSIAERQKIILYQIDHPSLAVLLRDFAARQRWSAAQPPQDSAFLYADDPAVPPALKLLRPSSVRINDESIDLEFGGALLHFGISAFRPGLAGSGTKQLGEGLWFYSENGRYPSKP
ncbi:MAG TPA: hypothetical protein VK961_08730 [Chthoniobacter sp.]|nr:hypothetical protein [Chthoniobacter sp.]